MKGSIMTIRLPQPMKDGLIEAAEARGMRQVTIIQLALADWLIKNTKADA